MEATMMEETTATFHNVSIRDLNRVVGTERGLSSPGDQTWEEILSPSTPGLDLDPGKNSNSSNISRQLLSLAPDQTQGVSHSFSTSSASSASSPPPASATLPWQDAGVSGNVSTTSVSITQEIAQNFSSLQAHVPTKGPPAGVGGNVDVSPGDYSANPPGDRDLSTLQVTPDTISRHAAAALEGGDTGWTAGNESTSARDSASASASATDSWTTEAKLPPREQYAVNTQRGVSDVAGTGSASGNSGTSGYGYGSGFSQGQGEDQGRGQASYLAQVTDTALTTNSHSGEGNVTSGTWQHGSYATTSPPQWADGNDTTGNYTTLDPVNRTSYDTTAATSFFNDSSAPLGLGNNSISPSQHFENVTRWITESTGDTLGDSPAGFNFDFNLTTEATVLGITHQPNTSATTASLDFIMGSSDSLEIHFQGLDTMDPKTDSPCGATGGFLCQLWQDHPWYNVSGFNETLFGPGATDYYQGDGMARNWHVLMLGLIVLAGIMGNVLVCIAVFVDKKLQNVTNYFLVSLAVADLFVSLIVMPCSIVHEFMGYWPFGLVVCDLWQVLDVMLCTSSIMHMCTISLDRYIGIKNPLKMRNKSRMVVGLKIAAVWMISLIIASPIILLSILDPSNVLDDNNNCAIFNHYFLIYGSLAAFFIPLVIMLVAYTLTIYLLNKQAQKCSGKSREGMRRSLSRKKRPNSRSSQGSNGSSPSSSQRHRLRNGTAANGFHVTKKLHRNSGRKNAHPSETEPLHNTKYESMDSTDQTSLSSFERLKRQKQRLDTTEEGTAGPPRLQQLVKKHSVAIKAASIMIARRDHFATKHKMNNVRTERKAVKVLGTMFAFFVLCWGPFFSINFAMGVCTDCDIQVILFKIFLWLGYMSSTLNPIIYTIFNKNFRQTFARLLCGLCRWVKHKRRKRLAQLYTYQTNGTSVRCNFDMANLEKLDDMVETIV